MATYKEEDFSIACAVCGKEFGDHFSTIGALKKEHYHCPKEDGSNNRDVEKRTYFKSASCN
jgi:hypothetical protein